MTVLMRITTESNGKVSKRAHRRAMKSTMKDVGETWQKDMLPRHFTYRAAQLYGHRPRSPKYLKYKKRAAQRGKPIKTDLGRVVPKKGGRVDNVLSGRLETAMKRHHIVRAFPTRATIRMPAPSYITGRRKKQANYPNIARELTTVTRDEKDKLNKVAGDQYAKHIERESLRTRTRKRVG